ncbi:MAG: hypothetical protein WKF82_08565 [Nocardioidaceae bacterium]
MPWPLAPFLAPPRGRKGGEWSGFIALAMEPRRLARRYLVDDLPYACGLLAEASVAPNSSSSPFDWRLFPGFHYW